MTVTHIDVLTYAFAIDNPYSIPSDWPYKIKEISDTNDVVETNYFRLTKAEYETYVTDSTRLADYNTVMNYIDTMSNIEKSITAAVTNAAAFGRDIMLEYGTRNVLAGKTPTQVSEIMTRMSKVQQLVMGGALYTALEELDNVVVDGTIIDNTNMLYFKNKIRGYLGMTLI